MSCASDERGQQSAVVAAAAAAAASDADDTPVLQLGLQTGAVDANFDFAKGKTEDCGGATAAELPDYALSNQASEAAKRYIHQHLDGLLHLDNASCHQRQ